MSKLTRAELTLLVMAAALSFAACHHPKQSNPIPPAPKVTFLGNQGLQIVEYGFPQEETRLVLPEHSLDAGGLHSWHLFAAIRDHNVMQTGIAVTLRKPALLEPVDLAVAPPHQLLPLSAVQSPVMARNPRVLEALFDEHLLKTGLATGLRFTIAGSASFNRFKVSPDSFQELNDAIVTYSNSAALSPNRPFAKDLAP